ncbi:pilus assembly protein CpaC [Volucribacter psittacicida]|uniref:Pilus assembly protein CpaC n=1 Tax=Volucribacter psittacicida TaxID=203482 RepID=A0A4R1FVE0_9PAST|nr:type II and III secretion system protein family protein [Volucribacter psittacicida]TCJ97822.1 pilus assembly protein CpaC [Volucribacter psittacicida]
MLNKIFTKKLICLAFCGIAIFYSSLVSARSVYLEKGQSNIVNTSAKIDTIFISNPDVADYEIIDDNSFILYAKEEGVSEVTVFDQEGNSILDDTLSVNALINNISDANRQIKARFPNSKLQVKKIGKAYVIEGTASSNAESEEVQHIVGAALGISPKVTEFSLQNSRGAEERISFMDKYEYEGVINNSHVDDNIQINVKLTVVEVNKDFSDSLGINWSNLSGNLFNNIGASASVVGGAFDGVTGSLSIINANNLRLFINAVNNQRNAKILAEPNVSMLSGETADILVGGEIPFAQRDREGAASIIYKDFGIKLLVGAKVQKNDRIRLVLSQEVSNIAGSYQYDGVGQVPYFNTRRSKSTFELADGESFIIGGLFTSNDIEQLNKIPLLGDIPIIGSFFRSASTSRDKKELVIVATVNSIKPVNEADIVYPNFQQTGTMERFFNVTPLKDVYYKTLTTNFLKNGGFIQ